jgi:hypothetical protein
MSHQARPVTDASGVSEAFELLRQVEASDVHAETLERIDHAVDRLCRSYSSRPPGEVRRSSRQLLR